jgi:GTPase involved in cell partitioning and DNA repair
VGKVSLHRADGEDIYIEVPIGTIAKMKKAR